VTGPRVALVTGASRGIGAATAAAFAATGAAVVLAARSADALQQVADAITGAGGTALAVPTDVSSEADVDRLVNRTRETFGRLDYACNNAAGGNRRPTPVGDMEVSAWDGELAVSLRGLCLCLRAEVRLMQEAGGGAIVNMSSTAGLQGVAGLAQYVTAKHGVEGLTKAAALDYAGRGVRINSVAPGPILTDPLAAAGPEALSAAAAAVPAGRIGTASEVADAVVWLCSEHAGFITGATLVIDGGKLAGTPPFQVRGGSFQPRAS
jgi:NAD(P)-dependent dehydrogenase (short-subunit alcohol dehydrogenase family)